MSHKLRFNSLGFFHIWTLLCPCVVFALQLPHKTLRLSHSVQSPPPNHKQQSSQATGKQHYLRANPSHGARQLQTLHVIPPCHLHYTYLCAHIYTYTWRHTPQVSNHPAHFPTISSLSFPVYPSLSACHSLSLALCKIALRRAATVLRNSVIYWQFPP